MQRKPKSNTKKAMGLLAWLDFEPRRQAAGGSAQFLSIAKLEIALAKKVRLLADTYGVTRQTGYNWLGDYHNRGIEDVKK